MTVNRVILKRKTENRLNQIKTFLAGAKTAAEVEKLVEKDWQRAEYFGKGKKEFVEPLILTILTVDNRFYSSSSTVITAFLI